MQSTSQSVEYRGRLAPSPTGYLHLGHARTFWVASERARRRGGTLVFRMEDLDPQRSRKEFASSFAEDMHWLGIEWQEGPECCGEFGPYLQSQRRKLYLSAWRKLLLEGAIYPCTCSRRELNDAAAAPHEDGDEILYPGYCREKKLREEPATPFDYNWRFRVPQGECIKFTDGRQGPQRFIAGEDFGDFVIWRRDDVPAYQLAVVVDDAAMGITEVVRGADLLRSVARQRLLQKALGLPQPSYYHCELMTDESGIRLSKRDQARSLRDLRQSGADPSTWVAQWEREFFIDATSM